MSPPTARWGFLKCLNHKKREAATANKASSYLKRFRVICYLLISHKLEAPFACSCSVFSGLSEVTTRSRQCNHIKDSTSYLALAIRLEILLVIANLTSSITQSTQHTIPSALHRPFNFTYSVYLPQPPYYSHQHPRYLPDKVRHPRRMVYVVYALIKSID